MWRLLQYKYIIRQLQSFVHDRTDMIGWTIPFICYLIEHKGFIIPDWVQRVVVRSFCSIFSFSVCRKSKHVYLHINTNLLIVQKLTWDDLCMQVKGERWSDCTYYIWKKKKLKHYYYTITMLYYYYNFKLNDTGEHNTLILTVLATMPSTMPIVKGSKCLSVRLMNSGFSR